MQNASEQYHDRGGLARAANSLANEPTSLVGRLARFFQQHPGEWVDGRALAMIAGNYAWRSRVSDLRRAPFLMTICNRQIRRKAPSGKRFVISEYKFVEPPSTGGAI